MNIRRVATGECDISLHQSTLALEVMIKLIKALSEDNFDRFFPALSVDQQYTQVFSFRGWSGGT